MPTYPPWMIAPAAGVSPIGGTTAPTPQPTGNTTSPTGGAGGGGNNYSGMNGGAGGGVLGGFLQQLAAYHDQQQPILTADQRGIMQDWRTANPLPSGGPQPGMYRDRLEAFRTANPDFITEEQRQQMRQRVQNRPRLLGQFGLAGSTPVPSMNASRGMQPL